MTRESIRICGAESRRVRDAVGNRLARDRSNRARLDVSPGHLAIRILAEQALKHLLILVGRGRHEAAESSSLKTQQSVSGKRHKTGMCAYHQLVLRQAGANEHAAGSAHRAIGAGSSGLAGQAERRVQRARVARVAAIRVARGGQRLGRQVELGLGHQRHCTKCQ